MKLTAKSRLFTETLPALKSARAYFSRPAIQAAATAAGLELKPGVLNVYLHRAVQRDGRSRCATARGCRDTAIPNSTTQRRWVSRNTRRRA